MRRAPYPAAAEALADRLLQSIRPQVVQIIAEALANKLQETKPGEVELTEEDHAQAAQCVARWNRSQTKVSMRR